jgi:hypothetical protein
MPTGSSAKEQIPTYIRVVPSLLTGNLFPKLKELLFIQAEQ